MKAVHRTNPDPQRRAPAGVCARCGGELYPGEACWRLWGALLCERCAGRRALEELGVEDGRRLIDKMIVADYLMANFDRHTHNFGLLRSVEGLDGYRIALEAAGLMAP